MVVGEGLSGWGNFLREQKSSLPCLALPGACNALQWHFTRGRTSCKTSQCPQTLPLQVLVIFYIICCHVSNFHGIFIRGSFHFKKPRSLLINKKQFFIKTLLRTCSTSVTYSESTTNSSSLASYTSAVYFLHWSLESLQVILESCHQLLPNSS